jgi:hypothetical protein
LLRNSFQSFRVLKFKFNLSKLFFHIFKSKNLFRINLLQGFYLFLKMKTWKVAFRLFLIIFNLHLLIFFSFLLCSQGLSFGN